MSRTPLAPLPPDACAEIEAWLATEGVTAPASVRIALEHYGDLARELVSGRRSHKQLLEEFRRALGITPSTERRSSGPVLGPVSQGDRKKPRTEREKLELGIERSERLTDWHKDLADDHSMKGKRMKQRLADLPPEDEKVELSEEQKAKNRRETQEFVARLRLGNGPDPALSSVHETLMAGHQANLEEEFEYIEADVSTDAQVIDTLVDERERYDFSFSVRRVNVQVEKKVVIGQDGERHVVSGSTHCLGPPRMAVTWDFLAHMAMLVVQYAMPLHRLGKLLTTSEKKFTAGTLGRYLHYVAERTAPIYIELAQQLADSPILQGDDTSCRVLEVNRFFANPDSDETPPWARYATPERAHQALATVSGDALGPQLAAELGFEFERRNSDGTKQSLNTTTLSGRSVDADPRSLIVLYRSHLGGLGNLLNVVLQNRTPTNRELIIQSDLSTVNLVSDSTLNARFAIQQVGCMSHARRPFALYEDEDPVYGPWIVHEFKGIAIQEYGLNMAGRNRENVLAVRDVDSRATWAKIKEIAEDMQEHWSPSTKLGAAARYVTRHFDKLTVYLDDPRLEPTNNFSERMLRLEKLIERNALFRQTLEGRFALDILRSVLQTAVAAGVPLRDYLLYVLQAEPDDVAAAPEQYTPRAYAALREDRAGVGRAAA